MEQSFQNSERDSCDYGASRLNSVTQSGPEINRKRGEMSKKDDKRILKMHFQVIENKAFF